jgi:hypothetical protein
MVFSNKLVLILTGGLFTLPVVASADDLTAGRYEVDGYVTKSTCAAPLAQGAAVSSWAYYPGANTKGLQIAAPSTSGSGGAGDASTNICFATAAIPAAGLNGASLTLNCYNNTDAGPGTLQSQRTSTFKAGDSHSTSVWQVSTTSNVIVNKKTVCNFTSDTTWTLE